jgi:hypothetical protein
MKLLYLIVEVLASGTEPVMPTWNRHFAYDQCDKMNDEWYSEHSEMPYDVWVLTVPEEKNAPAVR